MRTDRTSGSSWRPIFLSLPVIECGAIESTLTRYVREHDIDLVVMGSHGRRALLSLLLGSAAAKLLDWSPCDTLVVREPTATTYSSASYGASVWLLSPDPADHQPWLKFWSAHVGPDTRQRA